MRVHRCIDAVLDPVFWQAVWDLLDGLPLRSIQCHAGIPVRQLQLSPTSIMSVAADGTMEVCWRWWCSETQRWCSKPHPPRPWQLWDLLSGDKVMTVRPNHANATADGGAQEADTRMLAAQFDSHQIIAAFAHGEIKRWVLLSET